MRLTLMMLPILAALAACAEQGTSEPVRILKSDGGQVVIRGLIDATRSTPPPRYDMLAAAECAKSGKTASLVSMTQASTFAFDVTYRCAG